MLADASDREHEILGAIPYQPNEAVLHTDRALLPRRRRAWASWNYHLLPEPTGMTTVTYHMNRLQALDADREFCVTLNRSEAIDPAKVLRTISYAHPVFTSEGARAQARHAEISGAQPHALRGRLLGLGLPRGRRRQRACASASASGRACDAGCTSGTIRHRRFAVREHAFTHRIALAYVDSTRRRALPPRTTSATGGAAARAVSADPRAGEPPTGRSGCCRPALFARLQPGQLLLLLRPAAS